MMIVFLAVTLRVVFWATWGGDIILYWCVMLSTCIVACIGRAWRVCGIVAVMSVLVLGAVHIFWMRSVLTGTVMHSSVGSMHNTITGQIVGYRGQGIVVQDEYKRDWIVYHTVTHAQKLGLVSLPVYNIGDIVLVTGEHDTKPYYELCAQTNAYVKEKNMGDSVARLWYIGRLVVTCLPQHNNSTYANNTSHMPLHALRMKWMSVWTFNFARWRQLQGYDGSIYSTSIHVLDNNTEGLLRMRGWVRNRIVDVYGIDGLGGYRDRAGLLLGMIIGDTSLQSPNMSEIFRASGLSHITAVSGGNIALLLIVLGRLLIRVPVYIRYVIMILVIIGYGYICGWESSVTRAVMMGTIGLLALIVGRLTMLVRTLAITMILMVLRRPYSLLFDAGFQLSFVAVAGIAALNTLWPQIRFSGCIGKCVRHVRDILVPLLGASWAVFPLLIVLFGSVGVMTLCANLLVAPVIGVVMIGGIVSLFLPIVSVVVGWGLSYITHIALRATSYGTIDILTMRGAAITIGLWVVWTCVITAFMVYILRINSKK